MARSLTLSDVLANIPKLRAKAEQRKAELEAELAELESTIAQLGGLGSSFRGGRRAKASHAGGRRKGGRRRARGSGPSGRDILVGIVKSKGLLATSEAKSAYVKAGLAPAGASVTLNGLKKDGIITNGKERGSWTKGKNFPS